MTRRYLVADLFCGAGGSSTGALQAIRELGGEMDLVAVNHWPMAIETHQKNHPHARHYVEDVSAADPDQIVPGGRLDLLMASPECRFHSRARGGKPTHDQGRMSAWAVLHWMTRLDVRTVLIENVPEFVSWGPLCTLPNGHRGKHNSTPMKTDKPCNRPDKAKQGLYFQGWFNAILALGYQAEWRYLNAADFGDATTRIRFFLQARKDGVNIQWPTATHSKIGDEDMLGRRPKWRAAREIIEWANVGRSLLDHPKYLAKPLAEKTRRRIARGMEKFCGPLAPLYIALLGLESNESGASPGVEPFVMGKQSNPSLRSVSDPLPTFTTEGTPLLLVPTVEPFVQANRNNNTPKSVGGPIPSVTTSTGGGSYLVQPSVEPFVIGQQSLGAPRSTGDPIPTIAAAGAISLIKPTLVKYNGNGGPASVDKPLPTQTGKARFGLATPLIVAYGPRANSRSVDDPLPTVMTKDRLAVAMPIVRPFLVPQFGERVGQAPRLHDPSCQPLPSVTSHGAGALVNPSLVEVNHGDDDRTGTRVHPIDAPLGTVTTKRGTGLVDPILVQVDQTGGNGTYTRSVDQPLPTLVTSKSVGLVEPFIDHAHQAVVQQISEGKLDPRRLACIDGRIYVLDIRFRMLTNLELARAMGFTDEEITYEFCGTSTEITKQIGNAVAVGTAKALAMSVLGAGP